MATATTSTKKSNRRAKSVSIREELSGLEMLGELVTWTAGANGAKHTRDSVISALKAADLSTDYAKEILPRHAFTRATKKMSDDRVIDVVAETEGVVSFQFTRKHLTKSEWHFEIETVLELNKETGTVTCENQELRERAQSLVNRFTLERNTSDITRIVQQLFEAHADLIPIRDQGGVYFVPNEFREFSIRVDAFLNALGGRLDRFPVPKGTQSGDRSVTEAVSSAMTRMVDDHLSAIGEFTVSTRNDTVERAATKIKETRVKIEAYANYLADRQSDLLKAVDAANEKLRIKVAEITTQKATLPANDNGTGKRSTLFGQSVTAIARWMGSQGWKHTDAMAVFTRHGVPMAKSTLIAQLGFGRKGKGTIPTLTDDQVAELVGTTPEVVEPVAPTKKAPAKKSKAKPAAKKPTAKKGKTAAA